MHFFAWNQVENIYDGWVIIKKTTLKITQWIFFKMEKMEIDTRSPSLSICTA